MTDQTTADPLVYRSDTSGWADLERGEFCYRRGDDGRPKWLSFWPRDSKFPLSAAIVPQRNSSGASWTLSGTEEQPTLQPSVNAEGKWHGFLTNGVAKQ